MSDEKWMQKARDAMKRKGTVGLFTWAAETLVGIAAFSLRPRKRRGLQKGLHSCKQRSASAVGQTVDLVYFR